MIQVSKLNDKDYYINCDLIETIESTPDTTITTTNGRKVVVRESVEEVIGKIVEYKRKIFTKY